MLDKARTFPARARSASARAEQQVEAYFDRGPIRRGLYSLVQGYRRHHLAQAASTMAFDLFLATIPMVALAGWASATLVRESPSALGAVSAVVDQSPAAVRAIMNRSLGRLHGAVAPLAVLGSLWLSSSAFHTFMRVFEISLEAHRRPWWKKRLLALGCVVASIAGVGATSYVALLVSGGPARIFELVTHGRSEIMVGASSYLAALVMVAAAVVLLAGFFRIAVVFPGVERRVWPGATLSVALGGLASYAFGYYVSTLARYALFYGSLAAVAIAMAWLWIWCAALLLGAELNTQLERAPRRHAPAPRALPRAEPTPLETPQPASPAPPTQTPKPPGSSFDD
ncbi:MAG: YihY/virulence factor BrkB family protein [Sorangiineae bacterium]|nr:YihY/virulence factor BrkB family protein [Polyangiaceae bacterium]MEB2323339.1 YihY/virulence factor BrkB family protein [Sorangiineae bacterium]